MSKNYIEEIFQMFHYFHHQSLKLVQSEQQSNDVLDQLGLGSRQGAILKILLGNDGITQRELTKRLQITSSSMGELLGKLEKGAYVERCANAADKRTADVHLTEKGRAAGEQYKASGSAMDQEWAAVLTDEEQAQLVMLLGKLKTGFDNKIN